MKNIKSCNSFIVAFDNIFTFFSTCLNILKSYQIFATSQLMWMLDIYFPSNKSYCEKHKLFLHAALSVFINMSKYFQHFLYQLFSCNKLADLKKSAFLADFFSYVIRFWQKFTSCIGYNKRKFWCSNWW